MGKGKRGGGGKGFRERLRGRMKGGKGKGRRIYFMSTLVCVCTEGCTLLFKTAL